MKRIRIWINSFTLIQQYIVVTFLALFLFIVFIFQSLNSNIDDFTNQQMYSYLHASQEQYIDAIGTGIQYEDSNVYQYLYSTRTNDYVQEVKEEVKYVFDAINPVIEGEREDGVLNIGDKSIAYSVKKFGKNFVVSILRDEYRSGFKSALVSAVANTSIIAVSVVFVLLMIWVYSLIRPLDLIRNYIQKIRNNENDTLNIKRNDEIGEVAEALVTMNEELKKQQRIREEMIQNISHDLKTPIATIKSYSESIKDGIYPYGTLEKSVDVISEHADRLEKKVYSLITYNKFGYLEDNSEGDNLYMPDVIAKAIVSCQVLRNDVEIIADDIKDDVYFHGEEEAWRTVVENLLDNALRYAKSKIVITLFDDVLEVYNDGELMDQDRIEKLFKPYQKGTKGNFGLGLSIIKKVCDTYGYNVVGENKNDGVVFRIYRNKPSKSDSRKNIV
ncbi:MAG: HAMP domain-containing histidine kinase [Erysipelotrichaceae bacterium]|nr:HAMP domain-containing histidine kinase [Erysipelotrichaceae bacterium]